TQTPPQIPHCITTAPMVFPPFRHKVQYNPHIFLLERCDGMRYMEMAKKEIVNIADGSRLGILGQTDLLIDEKTGRIKAILIPHYEFFGFKQQENMTEIK